MCRPKWICELKVNYILLMRVNSPAQIGAIKFNLVSTLQTSLFAEG